MTTVVEPSIAAGGAVEEVEASGVRIGWLYERAGVCAALCDSRTLDCIRADSAHPTREAALAALVQHYREHHLGAERIAARPLKT